jgi:hypothetical protein
MTKKRSGEETNKEFKNLDEAEIVSKIFKEKINL